MSVVAFGGVSTCFWEGLCKTRLAERGELCTRKVPLLLDVSCYEFRRYAAVRLDLGHIHYSANPPK